MQNLLWVGILVYGVLNFFFARRFGVETNLLWFFQTGAAILIGSVMTVISYKDHVFNFFKKPESLVYVPEDFEIKDFESLTHLRSRCELAGSAHGIEICRQLADILFLLNVKPELVVKAENEPKTV